MKRLRRKKMRTTATKIRQAITMPAMAPPDREAEEVERSSCASALFPLCPGEEVVEGVAEGGSTDGIGVKVEVDELDVARVEVEVAVVAVDTVVDWVVVVSISGDIVDKDVNVVIWVDDAEVVTAIVSMTVRVIGVEKIFESPLPVSGVTTSSGLTGDVVWRLWTKSCSARRRRR
jgi:hypothetical protein